MGDVSWFHVSIGAYAVLALLMAFLRWPPFLLAAAMHSLVLLLAISHGVGPEDFVLGGPGSEDPMLVQQSFIRTIRASADKISGGLDAVYEAVQSGQKAGDDYDASDVMITKDIYTKYRDPDVQETFPFDENDRSFRLDAVDADDAGQFQRMVEEYRDFNAWYKSLPPPAQKLMTDFVSAP